MLFAFWFLLASRAQSKIAGPGSAPLHPTLNAARFRGLQTTKGFASRSDGVKSPCLQIFGRKIQKLIKFKSLIAKHLNERLISSATPDDVRYRAT